MSGAEFRLLDLDSGKNSEGQSLGSLAAILLRDPDQNGNALTQSLLSSLIQQLEVWSSRPHNSPIRALILRSSSEIAFSVGMDFGAFQAQSGAAASASANTEATKPTKSAEQDAAAQYCKCLDLIYRFPAPVICLLEKPAKAGGVGLLMAADFILAGAEASMNLGEALFGLIPANVLPYLRKRIGERKANQMVFQPQPLDAQTLFAWGLIDMPPCTGSYTDLCKSLKTVLRSLLRCSPEALRVQKEFRLHDLPFEQQQEIAQQILAQRMASQEVHDGISAFLDGGLGPWSAKPPSSLADDLA